jgi:arsenate reductase (glutaredoxin)
MERTAMKALTVYGIPNCDTVKRARTWLQAQDVAHRFHDFKREGLPAERLQAWTQALGWEAVLNRRGTTWRKLDEATRETTADAATAFALMQAQPSLVKRPVVEWPDGQVSVGFDAEAWAARLG